MPEGWAGDPGQGSEARGIRPVMGRTFGAPLVDLKVPLPAPAAGGGGVPRFFLGLFVFADEELLAFGPRR